ncbi:MAG: TRP75-related protein [Wolbachia sp.]
MLRIFSEVLFILIFFSFSFFVSYDTEAKSKVKLSKKYVPQGNPGGTSFYEDEDFAESYRLYEKRRELLKKKKLQSRANANMNKESLAKKLKEKKIALLSNKSNDMKSCMVENEKDAMINQHGINITRLKGAVFIDQAQYEDEQFESKQQEGKKSTTIREKKKFPINITIKDSTSKKTCSRDSIVGLNNMMQHSLNGSDSFGSIADTVK